MKLIFISKINSEFININQLTVHDDSHLLLDKLLTITNFPGDPAFIQIDQYSFSLGPHSLTIAYNATSGEQGTFQYNFTGILRQREFSF